MRTILIALASVGWCLMSTCPLRAGVYSTEDTDPWPPLRSFRQLQVVKAELGFDQFHLLLSDVRGAAVELPNRLGRVLFLVTAEMQPQGDFLPGRLVLSLQEALPHLTRETLGSRYLKRAAELEAKEKNGGWTTEDRINLGFYYIRLVQPSKAIRVLTPAASQDKPHFLALANLATAYELAGVMDRAISYRQLALSAWPRQWEGWKTGQLYWYRRAEKYHLTLLKLRAREAPGQEPDRVDALFPGVRFTGPDGSYAPGPISPDQWAELPDDALPIVYQLVLWRPLDDRLYWLFGELLNAQGDVESATRVLRELVTKYAQLQQSAPIELRRHANVLKNTPKTADVLLEEKPVQSGGTQTPSVTAAGPEAGTATNAQAGWLPDWRQVVVGFVAGVLLTLLGVWQLRESRRRRQYGMAGFNRG
jgi:tetratricopeptide (TPR) repeat protein